jgi:hypothetical protein
MKEKLKFIGDIILNKFSFITSKFEYFLTNIFFLRCLRFAQSITHAHHAETFIILLLLLIMFCYPYNCPQYHLRTNHIPALELFVLYTNMHLLNTLSRMIVFHHRHHFPCTFHNQFHLKE